MQSGLWVSYRPWHESPRGYLQKHPSYMAPGVGFWTKCEPCATNTMRSHIPEMEFMRALQFLTRDMLS